MLRHFKMELKRQQERENQELQTCGNLLMAHQQENQIQSVNRQQAARPLAATDAQAIDLKRRKGNELVGKQLQQPKRVRGRRSSKPAMEKRRRARINECLDILKSYVLNDTGNLNALGIDLSAGENRLDEDSIARQILKSSGLINRHRGRKNPNKLEKADILELTVDYVRRLHEQRDELLVTAVLAPQHLQQQQQQQQTTNRLKYAAGNCTQQVLVPAHLSEPLTLDLSPKSRLTTTGTTPPPTLQAAAYRPPPNTPLTPPASDGGNQTVPGTTQAAFLQQNQMSQMQLLSQVLADVRYQPYDYDYVSFSNQQQQQ